MDVTSFLKNEIFRPLTTLVIPGSFAIGPFVILCQNHSKPISDFSKTNPNLYAAVLFILVLASGLVLEDLGGHLETKFSNDLEKENIKHKLVWHDYLKLNTQDQFIGQRYLRTIVTRLYFELSMVPALALFLIGFLCLDFFDPFIRCSGAVVISILTIGLGVYLFFEAKRSVCVLSSLRETIIEGYGEYNSQHKDS